MADPLERVTNLVTLLLNTRLPIVAEDIFHALGNAYPADDQARHTMFERDKRTLRDAAVPLRTKATDGDGRIGYWIDGREWFLPELDLTDDERVALHVAVAAVHLGVAWGDAALAKVADADPDDVVSAPSAAVAATVVDLPHLPVLVDAQRRRAPASFAYRGSSRRAPARQTYRTVEPWGVLLREGFWYLAGRDLDRDDLRHFRVDRIEAGSVAVGAEGTFRPPDGYTPGDGFPTDPKLLGDAEPVDARVRIWPPHAARVAASVGEERVESTLDDGSVVVVVAVRNRDAFRSWVLGLLDHAEVLDPAELRDDLVAWLVGVGNGVSP